ncbi:MAG: hypothetical protein QM820_51950 [Minicystis sp.]
MRIETSEAGVARCFEGGALTSEGTAFLTREARRRASWDADAFAAFSDRYWHASGADWAAGRVGLLLTADALAQTVMLAQWLERSGFPGRIAGEQADLVVRTRQKRADHPPLRTGLLVVLRRTGGLKSIAPTSPPEVLLRGDADDQAVIARAFGPGTRSENLAALVRTACDHVADRCLADPSLRDLLIDTDWSDTRLTPAVIRGLPGGGSRRTPEDRALVEVLLGIYLERHGFSDLAGPLGGKVAEAWSGGGDSLPPLRLRRGPSDYGDSPDKLAPLLASADPDFVPSSPALGFAGASPSIVLAQYRPPQAGSGGTTPAQPTQYVEYRIKVPRNIKTERELDRYAEALIFGRVMNLDWEQKGWDVAAMAREGKTVAYRYRASTVNKYGARPPSEVTRPAPHNAAYDGATGQKKGALNQEIDRRYWEGTGTKPGEKIKPGEQDKADMWNMYRDQVMKDHDALAKLPPEIRAFFGTDPSARPPAYAQLRRIVDKLKGLTPDELALYKMLAPQKSDDLDLFERALNLFIARKDELKAAQKAPATQKADTMEAAVSAAWSPSDTAGIDKLSEADRYALARRKTTEVMNAQLKYMAAHPGEVAVDFAKTATLMNSGETFKGIGKDIAEAADGNANSWARWAGGVGAGAKLAGWMLAVAGVVYALSWLTGIGELATIAAFMGYMLGAAIVLSTAESELRIKAASQAKTEAEFKTQVEKAAAARLNVVMMVAMLALALAIRFLAKTAFPQTVRNLSRSISRFRETIRIAGKIADKKAAIAAELRSGRAELLKAGESAKQSSVAQAEAIEAMSLDDFVAKLESGELAPEAKLGPDQKIPWSELAKTPEGRSAIDAYRQRLTNALRSEIPKEIDALVKEQTDAVDRTLADIEKATIPEEVADALDKHQSFLKDSEVAARAKAREQRAAERAAEEALAAKDPPPVDLRLVAETLRTGILETEPAKMRARRLEIIAELRNVHGGKAPKYEGYVLDEILRENQLALAKSRATLLASNPDVIVGMERGGAFLTEALAKGDPVLGAKVRKMLVDLAQTAKDQKAGKFDAQKMQAKFQKLIDGGAKKIAIFDAYMGGRTGRAMVDQNLEAARAEEPGRGLRAALATRDVRAARRGRGRRGAPRRHGQQAEPVRELHQDLLRERPPGARRRHGRGDEPGREGFSPDLRLQREGDRGGDPQARTDHPAGAARPPEPPARRAEAAQPAHPGPGPAGREGQERVTS